MSPEQYEEFLDGLRALRQALGLFDGALPVSPCAAFLECVAHCRALRAEVAAVNTQMERMAREMGGQMDLVEQLTAENVGLRAALADAQDETRRAMAMYERQVWQAEQYAGEANTLRADNARLRAALAGQEAAP